MHKVTVAEYDEGGNRTVIGEADIEVEFKNGQIVITQAMVEVGTELARRIQGLPVPCELTFSHTHHWCGNSSCRES